MRLSNINPWSGASYAPPKKAEDAEAATTKPPDADDGVSGVQVQPVASAGDQPPDDAPSRALDITI